MKLKKGSLLLCLLLATLMIGTLASCKKTDGVIVCGVTPFEPMNYLDSKGKWTGFDTELAILVGKKLNMDVEFQEIEWSSKFNELEAGTIDCIWNGFTANIIDSTTGRPRSQDADFSLAYMLNQQCVVVKASREIDFMYKNDLLGKIAAAEAGSAGEGEAVVLVGEGGSVIGVPAQINSLTEVKSGAVDFAVMDILLAQKLVGQGDYSDLMIMPVELDYEVYAIGFKKGSDLTEKVNQALRELYDDGTMMELAQKYGLENSLILDEVSSVEIME